jgi:hypothetical protein
VRSGARGQWDTYGRLLLALLVVLLGLTVVACGGASKAGDEASLNAAAARSNPPGEEADNDSDRKAGEGYYDFDDADFRDYGEAADESVTRQVSMIVRRYYAAAATGNGAAACALLDPGFAKAVVAEYSHATAVLRGKTCAVAASKLFAQLHPQLSIDDSTLKVGPVRVHGGGGYVLLGFEGELPVRYLVIRRAGGQWKIDRLIDIDLP